MSGSDSGARFSPSHSASLHLNSNSKHRHVEEWKPALYPHLGDTHTNTPCLPLLLDHTQPSAFDSARIRGALGLYPSLSSSSSFSSTSLLASAPLSSSHLLSAGNRQQRHWSAAVVDGNVMPLRLMAVQKSEMGSEYWQLPAESCWMIASRRSRRDVTDEKQGFNYHNYWIPTMRLIC